MAKSKYDPETFPELAKQYAREGLTDKLIIKKLGIGTDTFYKYIKRYPEFAEALKEGKKPVDIQVESALLKKALGYSYEEVTEEVDSEGNVTTKTKTVHVKGDTTAEIFWLKNRCPARWRDKQEIQQTGELKIVIDSDDKDV